jgi:hypothetical protein
MTRNTKLENSARRYACERRQERYRRFDCQRRLHLQPYDNEREQRRRDLNRANMQSCRNRMRQWRECVLNLEPTSDLSDMKKSIFLQIFPEDADATISNKQVFGMFSVMYRWWIAFEADTNYPDPETD